MTPKYSPVAGALPSPRRGGAPEPDVELSPIVEPEAPHRRSGSLRLRVLTLGVRSVRNALRRLPIPYELALLLAGCTVMLLGSVFVIDHIQPTPEMEAQYLKEKMAQIRKMQCYQQRDLGLIDSLRKSTVEMGSTGSTATLLKAPRRFKASLFAQLSLDLTKAEAQSLNISSANYDPRFVYQSDMIHCSVPELAQYALTQNHTDKNKTTNVETVVIEPLRLWDSVLTNVAGPKDPASTLCNSTALSSKADVTIDKRTILIARQYTQNSYYRLTSALNAWVLMRTLNWTASEVQVVHLDEAVEMPIDTLHQELLSPKHAILTGSQLKGKRVAFSSQVMVPPIQSVGPMMQDLDKDNYACPGSVLIQQFRQASMQALNVDANMDRKPSTGPIVVTFVTRAGTNSSENPATGIWRNEAEVVETLRATYAGKNVHIRSFDYALTDLQEQMQMVKESDVLIGMHGNGGMANALWLRHNTLVIEIFPLLPERWETRNLCMSVRCIYRHFRGGSDIPTGDPKDIETVDKQISPKEFTGYFNPMLAEYVKYLGRKIENEVLQTASGST